MTHEPERDPTVIKFYDTTLRDGEQMPEVAFSPRERVQIARALDELGLDEIEIGFAASGPEHRKDMVEIVDAGLRARLLSLARPIRSDIDAVKETGVDTVVIFIAVSPLHMKYKLRKTYEEICTMSAAAIEYAAGLGLRVQLSIEDATRADLDKVIGLAQHGVSAGAQRIGLADTVGIGTPTLMHRLVGAVVDAVDVPVSVHCHDDFGLAVANSLAAVEAGARVLSTTICGLGERSGNASTEQCAMALERLYGFKTNFNVERIYEVCRLVSECARVGIPPNKAIVGKNSFRHESGIHVAATLQEPLCYEPYDPALVGRTREIVLGKSSGRAALRHVAGPSADALDDGGLRQVLDRIKAIAEEGRTIEHAELLGLIAEVGTDA
ncbi:homocitrate synthase/isopropylmalate synthase family protein [Haliangium sp.]|uniref:homocitrate synthase/isopropylmalate synthase family protein n=1 Tax=Haliangium sp. TaxID=2663208 RepID=UPI003D0D38D0